MIARSILLLLASLIVSSARAGVEADATRQSDERLTFQTGAGWSPRIDINADAAMAYGISPSLSERLESWRQHGYRTEVMTGVAWGHYEDYLHGRWDGKDHQDERQTDRDGNPLRHDAHGDVWYMSPGQDYGRYLCDGVKRALDAGATAVYLEEPEFWVRSGYSPSFKREWQAYYHEDWRPPHESPDNQYRASKLKYSLYRRALAQVFDFVKRYGAEHGRQVPCYVATHSLLNYAHWRIVSPESSLLNVGCDGYIAQVWTGTARTPNVYEGALKSRTFETAFLEYGAMQNLVRASGRKVWYLNDPIEDNPHRSWADYRANWESTLVASLLQPEVFRFEVMPWPERVFNGKHLATDAAAPADLIPIPRDYETELQAVITAMGDLKQPPDRVKWEVSGTQGVGVLVSDTMMFQRGDPSPSDEHLGSFYGLSLPLLMRGMPVEPVQIESASDPAKADAFLARYKLLLLTYEGQKPPTPAFHDAIARWVKAGGALVVVNDDKDPYNAVREWWNTPPMHFATPREHLFQTLGLPSDATGLSRVGKGVVLFAKQSPAALTYANDGAAQVRELSHRAADAVGLDWRESPALALRRGPYIVAAGLDEPVEGAAPVALHGSFLSLFDPGLPIVHDASLTPGKRMLLIDLNAIGKGEGVVAAACRARNESNANGTIRFNVDGIEGSRAVVCVAMNHPPASVTLDGKAVPDSDRSFADGILRLNFTNSAAGRQVEILETRSEK